MNRGRPRHGDILTPREWEVLALIEQGLTNEQIAGRLNISFGTAKYHVAEIISKLGVERREQAPEAARRARVPAVPFWLAWLRSRFFWPAIGAGLVAAALLLLLSAVVFTDLLHDPSSSAPEGDLSEAIADFQPGDAASQADILARAPAELSSFYYEMRSSSREPMLPEQPPRNSASRSEVWYESPDKWRVVYYEGESDTVDSVHVTDGETEWHFDPKEGTYYVEPAELDPQYGLLPRPFIGPLPEANLQEYMDGASDGPAHYWEVNEEEPVQGRDALVLFQGCCRHGPLNQAISEQRHWVDPTYNFLLRHEQKSLGTGGVILYEVTELEYNPDLDDALFTFDPPEGATEVPPP